jgi:hypothetical protein
MEIVPIEFFGVALEIPFPSPQGVHQAQLEEFGAKLCHPVTGLNLRPNQIRLRRLDDLYDYEVTAQFFGENGSVSRGPDRAKLSVRNARNAADWNLVLTTMVRFYQLMDFAETSITALSCHVHVKFPSADDRDGFLSQFAHSFDVVRPASLGYVRIADWEKDIRVLIEQSNVVPNALFVGWDTQFTNSQDWDTFLSIIPTVMENSANVFGMGFEPFRAS